MSTALDGGPRPIDGDRDAVGRGARPTRSSTSRRWPPVPRHGRIPGERWRSTGRAPVHLLEALARGRPTPAIALRLDRRGVRRGPRRRRSPRSARSHPVSPYAASKCGAEAAVLDWPRRAASTCGDRAAVPAHRARADADLRVARPSRSATARGGKVGASAEIRRRQPRCGPGFSRCPRRGARLPAPPRSTGVRGARTMSPAGRASTCGRCFESAGRADRRRGDARGGCIAGPTCRYSVLIGDATQVAHRHRLDAHDSL